MKIILESISQIIQLVRTSTIKFPGKAVMFIQYISLIVDIMKQWYSMNRKDGNGPQIKNVSFR